MKRTTGFHPRSTRPFHVATAFVAVTSGLRMATVNLLVVTLILTACSKTPDEQLIAARIALIQEAVEAKKFIDIHSYLHQDFIANQRMGAEEVRRLLQLYSLQHRRLGVTILDATTVLDPVIEGRAESQLSVITTGSSGLLPTDGSVRKVKVIWEKHAGDWLVREANWR
ncbi:MAG: hypothetical protein AAGA91_19075 [Pseudomonadota bacterium]